MKIFKKMAGALLAMALLIMTAIPVLAANIELQFGDPTVQAGEQVEVKMKIISIDGTTPIQSASVTLSYPDDMLEFIPSDYATGGAGTIELNASGDGSSAMLDTPLTFKALSGGEAKIEVVQSSIVASDGTAMDVTAPGNSTVTVTGEAVGSTDTADAALSSLTIYPGTLTPSFSPDILEYSVDVGEDVERISIGAATSNADANHAVNGSDNLIAGQNQARITVTSADGTVTQVYIININKAGETAAAAVDPDPAETTAETTAPESTEDTAASERLLQQLRDNYEEKLSSANLIKWLLAAVCAVEAIVIILLIIFKTKRRHSPYEDDAPIYEDFDKDVDFDEEVSRGRNTRSKRFIKSLSAETEDLKDIFVKEDENLRIKKHGSITEDDFEPEVRDIRPEPAKEEQLEAEEEKASYSDAVLEAELSRQLQKELEEAATASGTLAKDEDGDDDEDFEFFQL